ncbi:unnamed protein product [Euphydryas editha]|uniref:Endonuclease/exonuclease/phosphatase domain-containing protein n=1 Tax=Euphydryas editha TaxID=104508 RepID=A0AAU9UC40_EUPED|nr:unnamed protein product [Euphydryas editha]
MDKLTLGVGIIYRPGDTSIKNFMDLFSTQLERRKRLIIFGDFNIDLLSTDNHVIEYMNELEETGIKIINKIDRKFSIRETNTTSTISDHNYTNVNNHSFNMSIIDSSFSDHKQIFLDIGALAPQITKKILYEAPNYEDLYASGLSGETPGDMPGDADGRGPLGRIFPWYEKTVQRRKLQEGGTLWKCLSRKLFTLEKNDIRNLNIIFEDLSTDLYTYGFEEKIFFEFQF